MNATAEKLKAPFPWFGGKSRVAHLVWERFALCGYEGEHNKLERKGWDKIAWKSMGGYGNHSGGKNTNRGRERIWFSPHCTGKGLF